MKAKRKHSRRAVMHRTRQAGLQTKLQSLRPSFEPLEGRLMMAADAFLQGTAFYGVNNLPKPNAEIDLYTSTDGFLTQSLVATTTTDPNGYYRFGGLEPGTYRIVEPASISYSSADTQIVSDVYEATEISANTIEVVIPDYESDNVDPGIDDLYLTWVDFVRPNVPTTPVENVNVSLTINSITDTFNNASAQLRDKLGTTLSGSDVTPSFLSLCVDLNALVNQKGVTRIPLCCDFVI